MGFTRTLQDIGLLLVRLIVGGILIVHAYRRYELGPDHLIGVLSNLGVPAPTVFGWGTLGFEALGGLLLICGLATPLIGLVLVAEQVMLIVYSKWDNGFFIKDGGFEYNLALLALGLVLLVFGAGRTGMDNLFTNPSTGNEQRFIDDNAPA